MIKLEELVFLVGQKELRIFELDRDLVKANQELDGLRSKITKLILELENAKGIRTHERFLQEGGNVRQGCEREGCEDLEQQASI